MCRLRNIAMHDYQESMTTRQTGTGQSDPFVTLCFAGNPKEPGRRIAQNNVETENVIFLSNSNLLQLKHVVTDIS